MSSTESERNVANELRCSISVRVLQDEWFRCMEDDAECMAARTRAKKEDTNPKRLKSKQSNAEKRAARTTIPVSKPFPVLKRVQRLVILQLSFFQSFDSHYFYNLLDSFRLSPTVPSHLH